MALLRRRIEKLLEMASEGKLVLCSTLAPEMRKQLERDLASIRRDAAGEIDLASCTSIVRTLAKTVSFMAEMQEPESAAEEPVPTGDPGTESQRMQQEFFSILDEFFTRATGGGYQDFATSETFVPEMRRQAAGLVPLLAEALPWLGEALEGFYGRNRETSFGTPSQLSGVKLVMGGSSYFRPTHLDAVRKMALYGDTILIPDPILPWFETERPDSKFGSVYPLEAAFTLLQLKPLVDAPLSVPAVVVFPSWERSLEAHDPTTQDGIEAFWIRFFSHYLQNRFDDIDEVVDYVGKREREFLRVVEQKTLFVPAGATGKESMAEGLALYREHIRKMRSEEYAARYESLPDGPLVLNGIMERLAPQYHMLENSESLGAQPMLCIEQQWHYYRLCTDVFVGDLLQESKLSPQTTAIIESLSQPEFRWLGNVPMESLVELRCNNENAAFRTRLGEHLSVLHESSLDDLDRVAAEVGRGIASLIEEHQADVERIQQEYRRKHAQTAVLAWVTVAASLFPALAPFLGVAAPLGLAAKYAFDKTEELLATRRAAKSLMGVLAATQE